MKDFVGSIARYAAGRAKSLKPLLPALREIHAGFTTNRSERRIDYFSSPPHLLSYLASIGVPNAARARFVLDACSAGLGPGERALDAGAGTGASALALASISHPDSEIVLLDRSGSALQEARSAFASLFPNGPRVTKVRADLLRGDRAVPKGPFQTVIAGHLLNELLPERGGGLGDAESLTGILANRTARDGTLVLIEPAQRAPSRALSRIRTLAIGEGYLPVGPCTHAKLCPVLAPRARDWCVVDVPWERPAVVAEADGLLGMDRTRLVVSYLAVSRAARMPNARVHEVLSEPMRAEGKTILYLCGQRGRLALRMPGPPNPPAPRGSRILLPAGLEPRGRDRSGAKRIEIDSVRLERPR